MKRTGSAVKELSRVQRHICRYSASCDFMVFWEFNVKARLCQVFHITQGHLYRLVIDVVGFLYSMAQEEIFLARC